MFGGSNTWTELFKAAVIFLVYHCGRVSLPSNLQLSSPERLNDGLQCGTDACIADMFCLNGGESRNKS